MTGSWHQQQAFKRNGYPKLSHPTLWSCVPASGFLSIMRFETKEQAETYAKNTGEIVIPPDNVKG